MQISKVEQNDIMLILDDAIKTKGVNLKFEDLSDYLWSYLLDFSDLENEYRERQFIDGSDIGFPRDLLSYFDSKYLDTIDEFIDLKKHSPSERR